VKTESSAQKAKQKSEMISTDDGMQIEGSNEQLENADLPKFETIHPLSNVTSESSLHEAKHDFGIVSIKEGIQIAFSDDQENVHSPRLETRHPVSKRRTDTAVQRQKQPDSIPSTSCQMITSPPLPKYRTADVPSKFIRKSSQTSSEQLAASTRISRISESIIHMLFVLENSGGSQIEVRDEHPRNADRPRLERREPLSKVRSERLVHCAKQNWEMT
jgi:hypothetical protein